MSCSFCIGNSRPPHFMSVDEFSHIINQVEPFTDYIYLHVLGEPLAHPNLQSLIEIASIHNLKVNITTNGTLLRKKQDVLLNSTALRKVSVSLHSLETDDANVRKQYLYDVANFANLATNKNILCELRLWNLGVDNIHNENIFYSICKNLQLDDETIKATENNININGSTTLKPKLFLGKAKRFNWPSMNVPLTNKSVYCYGLKSQFAILCDGTVVPCCLDSCGDINLGNIHTTNLKDILNSERCNAIRVGFLNRKPHEELCKRCGYATRF